MSPDRFLSGPARLLAWLGRHGTRTVAISLFVGLALPQLAAVFKPVLVPVVFALLVLAFLRVDAARVAHHARRLWLIALALAWMMLVVPLGMGVAVRLLDVGRWAPGLDVMLLLMSLAPPIMSSPAFAYLMRLDGALSLALLVLAMVVTPLTAPLVASLVAPDILPLSLAALAGRLFLLLIGSILLAKLIRLAVGEARIAAAREPIDGLNVIVLFVFAVSLMDGVREKLISDPLVVLAMLALTFALALSFIAATAFLFRRVGPSEALAIGLSAGNRNMGLMVAAIGAQLPDLGWLYFAIGQFPIYLLPLLMKPVADRALARGTAAG